MAEAVKVQRVGATKILKSKSEYSRCKIPRLVAAETKEEVNVGDRGDQATDEIEYEVFEGQVVEKLTEKERKRRIRKEK